MERVVEYSNLKERFASEFFDILCVHRINKHKHSLFKQTLEECNCILTDDEKVLFAKNGSTLKKLRSMFSNVNACIVLLIISIGEYNTKMLGEKFKLIPNIGNKSEPYAVIQHWIKEFRNQKLIQKSDFSEGMENIYEYSSKYPHIMEQLDKISKKKYAESLAQKDYNSVPQFFREVLGK